MTAFLFGYWVPKYKLICLQRKHCYSVSYHPCLYRTVFKLFSGVIAQNNIYLTCIGDSLYVVQKNTKDSITSFLFALKSKIGLNKRLFFYEPWVSETQSFLFHFKQFTYVNHKGFQPENGKSEFKGVKRWINHNEYFINFILNYYWCHWLNCQVNNFESVQFEWYKVFDIAVQRKCSEYVSPCLTFSSTASLWPIPSYSTYCSLGDDTSRENNRILPTAIERNSWVSGSKILLTSLIIALSCDFCWICIILSTLQLAGEAGQLFFVI